MTAARLLEHFARIAEAPGAVPRLRRFVLDLAVRGRLAEPDPTDTPVAVLQASLRSAFMTAERAHKRRPTVSETPTGPGVARHSGIPEHWTWMPLAHLGTMSGGLTPSKNRSDFWHGTVNWFSSQDIKSDELTNSLLKISELGARETGLRLYPPGSLVMVARSGILKRTFPVAVTRVPGTVNQDLKVLQPYVSGMERYLQIALRGQTEWILSRFVKQGTTVQSLKYEEFEHLPIAVPPLAEQQRIVAKVDELMALCDRLEAAQAERETSRARVVLTSLHRLKESDDARLRERAQFYIGHFSRCAVRAEHVRELRKGILNLAVTGRVAAQEPSDETGTELLARIQQHKERLLTEGSLRKAKPCRPTEGDGRLPASWAWTRLGEITDVGTGSTPSRANPSFWKSGSIPWVTSGLTSQSLITAAEEFVTARALSAGRLTIYPPGTLLVALYGQGKTRGQVAVLGIDATVNQACAAVCPLTGFHEMQPYLRLLLEKSYDEIREHAAGGPQPNLNVQKIKDIPVPLPPLAEQKRIVAKANELMGLCDRLEAQIETAGAEATRLLEALLHSNLADPSRVIAS